MNLHTRQMAFLGKANQETLARSIVAIVGVGALGSTSAHLLARMGVGKLILIDNDVVADHNLGRQHLYTVEDIGLAKVDALQKRIKAINPQISVQTHNEFLDEKNLSYLESADLILDGTDNHASRRIIDGYCKEAEKSWVHGAAIEDKGTVVFFSPKRSYEDVYGGKTKDQHCSISGVLVTATTLVATLQTQLALDALLGKELPHVMYRVSGSHIEEITL